MKSILTFLFSIMAVVGLRSANPSFSDFDTNHFQTSGNRVLSRGPWTNSPNCLVRWTQVNSNQFYFYNGVTNLPAGLFNDITFSTAFGLRSLTNASGVDNTAFGYQALQLLTSGQGNTMVGGGIGYVITTGNFNTGVGDGLFETVATGSRNNGFGAFTFQNMPDVNDNNGFGSFAGAHVQAGTNLLIGNFSDAGNASAGTTRYSIGLGDHTIVETKDISLGHSVNVNLNSGGDNVSIGHDIDYIGSGPTNSVGLGNRVFIGAKNAVFLGNAQVTTVITPGRMEATNGYASYSTLSTNSVGGTGYTNNQVINQVVYINGTGVSVTQKDRSGTTIVPATTFTGTMTILLQPGWAVTAASGLTGTAVPF